MRSLDELERLLEQRPDWFLRDARGQPIVDTIEEGRSLYLMDPASDGYRAWWASRATDLVRDNRWAGLFLDNVEATLGRFRRLAVMPQALTDDRWLEAVTGFLGHLRSRLGTEAWANITFADGHPGAVAAIRSHLDGDMDEAFGRWIREFEYGTVTVDPVLRTATITTSDHTSGS